MIFKYFIRNIFFVIMCRNVNDQKEKVTINFLRFISGSVLQQ